MPLGVDPNDIYQNGRWYNRSGQPADSAFAVVYRGTWAARPSTGLTIGDGAYFTDFPDQQQAWSWGGTRWVPQTYTTIYENLGIITGVQQVADQLLLAIPIPAGLLTGCKFALDVTFGRDSTTDAFGTSTAIRLGTTGTIADAALATANLSSNFGGTNRSCGLTNWSYASSATAVQKLGTANAGGSYDGATSGAALYTQVTVPNLDSNATFLSITTTMAGATTKPQLGHVRLTLQA